LTYIFQEYCDRNVGVFACGDNTTKTRTVANAIAMGTTAGMMANKEIVFREF